jgi:hypothetical protein
MPAVFGWMLLEGVCAECCFALLVGAQKQFGLRGRNERVFISVLWDAIKLN